MATATACLQRDIDRGIDTGMERGRAACRRLCRRLAAHRADVRRSGRRRRGIGESDPVRIGGINLLSFSPLGTRDQRHHLPRRPSGPQMCRPRSGDHRTACVCCGSTRRAGRGARTDAVERRRTRPRRPRKTHRGSRWRCCVPGRQVVLVNLSAGGVLVESPLACTRRRTSRTAPVRRRRVAKSPDGSCAVACCGLTAALLRRSHRV